MNTQHFWKRDLVGQTAVAATAVHPSQSGQSIVLIALALVAVIAFMGIALDVGFVFAKGSQLQAAMDSAALAGVTELYGWSTSNTESEADARTKSAQFLNANGMPLSVTLSLNEDENLNVSQTNLGAIQYAITGTWPVETFFLKVIGINDLITLSRSATAATFSLANVYASRRIEDGILSTSNQSVFGQNICTDYGDYFSPITSPDNSPYEYRIMIPDDYPHDIVRVEIMDPDSINKTNPGTITIPRTNAAINEGLDPILTSGSCADAYTGQPGSSIRKNACLIPTGELDLYNDGTLPLERINPYYFWRIDENRGAGAAPGNNSCGQPSSYNATYNTRTLYELYYWRQNPDGTIETEDLAFYTGQVGDGPRDNGDHDTDMRWVSPGAAQSFDQPVFVPADPGSPGDFEIDLTSEVPGILVEQGSGIRYINLRVTALEGASENGFELWAGPPDYVDTVASDANDRNLYALNSPGSHSSEGVTVFASGILPMNSNFNAPVDIPLVYFGPDYAGREVQVSMFDPDSGARLPITFFFDSISRDDWSYTFNHDSNDPDGNGVARRARCIIGGNPSCNNRWVLPYQITVPGGNLDECDYSDPDDPNCVPFYGGRLTAHYQTGFGDTYVWRITIEGVPYLVR
jgi:hypothetical protein